MKSYMAIAAVVALGAVTLGVVGHSRWASTPVAPGGMSATVTIQNLKFQPARVTIQEGASVTWVNRDVAACSLVGAGWGSPRIEPGQSWTQRFGVADLYPYYSFEHPAMQGVVRVFPGSGSTGTEPGPQPY